MDNEKTGALIRSLRRENGLTQLQLAQALHVSDKAVSKWERGMGAPDLALLSALTGMFNVDLQALCSGELERNDPLSGNLKGLRWYLCPHCGNVVTSMTETAVTCCGRKLQASLPAQASGEDRLSAERIENDLFLSSNHEMTREHFIPFVALVTSDTVLLKKLYPEWDLQVRLPLFAHGRLVWHCSRHGLFCQEV